MVNVTFSNIKVSNIKNFGVDIQQDYTNSGSTGIASNGVRVADITFTDVEGWVSPAAMNYYVLCGNGSCENFTFENVHIYGSDQLSSCDYPVGGCPHS